tara:strand:- start:251 stop:799 length:549 start_codon:yes stop_codon:yes gene_type:complete
MNDKDIILKMNNSIIFFEKELSSIRTSRANTAMLDNILVDAYGSKTPINQLGNINLPDATTLSIQIWDSSLIKNIETAINESNLGINPQVDGTNIRLIIPKLSEERRNELSKIASQYSENAKIVIRNIRREIIDIYKNQEKNKEISKDELKNNSDEVQKITDKYVKQIDEITLTKKNEITKV